MDNIDSIWLNIKQQHRELIIGLFYNSPRSTQEEMNIMIEQINAACTLHNHVLVCGDFNFPKIQWKILQSDLHGQPFLDCTLKNYLEQHVQKPTRKNNILDLVLSTPAIQITGINIDCPLGSSDHAMVKFEVENPDPTYQWQNFYLDFRKGKYRQFRRYLNEIEWDASFRGLQTSEMWQKFLTEMLTGIKNFIPKAQRSKKPMPLWMNGHIKETINKKKLAWTKYNTTRSSSDHKEYLIALNYTTSEIRRAKRDLEKKIANNIKEDPKAFYHYAKQKLKYKDEIPALADSTGKETKNDNEAANLLNQYFSSVFTREKNISFSVSAKVVPKESESGLPKITRDMIEQQISGLKDTKSAGVDNLPPIVLRKTAKAISYPLKLIYSSSLESGVVPSDWKYANVTPIHKKGSKNNPSNYRPISLTSQICRIFERILKEEINFYLETNKLIGDSQHGFVRGKSCLTNLLTYLDIITTNIDSGIPVDVVYLDFSKAFDTVPHQHLIMKLRSMQINEAIVRWIESWLSERKQRVVLRGTKSEWLPVISGVPQGSVLGPLLFLIYINDIDEEVTSPLLKFADDTKIVRPILTTEDHHQLQKDLEKLHQWAERWQMKFNASKCKVMHFGYNNEEMPYQMDGQTLETTDHERDLGVIVQKNLDVEKHIGVTTKKANKILGMIARTYDNKCKKSVTQLYKTLVRPILEYAAPAWRPYKQKHVDLIETVQRRATRMMEGLGSKTYHERLVNCNLISLEMRRRRADLIETFKIMNEYESLPAGTFFKKAIRISRGHSQKLFQPRSRLDPRKFFFAPRVVQSWNALPEEAINSGTINAFKGQIAPIFNSHRDLVRSQRWLPVLVPTISRT